jgi:asparagine synthase (glutamine-hydrolysing)
MCGIVGILEKNKKNINIEELKRFTHSLIHRGPDNFGTYINKENYIGLGHRRLSIIDLRDIGNQPMTIEDKYTIVFNGEIYNFEEIKRELKILGHSFKSKSDTEVLIHAYKEWGAECQNRFNGMWAFAIWDDSKKQLFISRDRFGVKPLYYLNNNNNFFFSSELKSFMKLDRENIPEFDDEIFINLGQNFSNQSYCVGKETFLKNVKELPPGFQLTIDKNFILKTNKWWKTIENLEIISSNENDIKQRFYELLSDACKLRMISDVKVATSLSGGIDSSSIIASINEIKKNDKDIGDNINFPHNAYILDYMGEKNNETQFAIDVAKYTNINPKLISIKPSNFSAEDLKKIIFHQEEVTGNDGLGPWEIYKSMRADNVKVSIDGHGADELLAGYSGYPRVAMKDTNIIKEFFYWLDLLKIHLVMNDKNNEESNLSKIIYDKIKDVLINKYKNKHDNQELNFFCKTDRKREILEFDEISNLTKLNQDLYVDYHSKAMSLTLKKFDKFSMAHGIETRFPFLDYRLANFCFALPNKFKINNGFTKKILRDVMRNKLPESVLNRLKKKGFTPENSYFNKEYQGFIKDTVSDNDFQNESMWKGHQIKDYVHSNNADYKKIFKYMQVYYIKKTFKEFSLSENN